MYSHVIQKSIVSSFINLVLFVLVRYSVCDPRNMDYVIVKNMALIICLKQLERGVTFNYSSKVIFVLKFN